MPRIELRYEGGGIRAFDAEPFETAYQAAARAGAAILTDCLEGACATCKARCVAGEYELLDPSFEALSPEEEAAGQVLLCQMEVRTDCVVELPYSLELAEGSGPGTVEARVTQLERLGPEMVRVTLRSASPLAFVPGQYARIEVPGAGVTRAYSFASSPGAARLEFFVRLLPRGAMSEYLAGPAAVGDRLHLEAPLGGFYVRPGAGPIVMVAGGTGLAPMLPMLGALAASGSVRPVRLLHGVREPRELFSIARVEALRRSGLPVDLACTVERGPPGPADTVGRVTDLLSGTDVGRDGTDVYVCGPPPMVAATEAIVASLGVPSARVFAERFSPA